MNTRLTGLLAATHTPTNVDGTLNLEPVERLAEHLVAQSFELAPNRHPRAPLWPNDGMLGL